MKGLYSFFVHFFAPLGIPLAWRQLTRDRKRFATAIIGVTFGVVLMLYEMGLYTASLRMVVLPHGLLKGDLVITSRNYEYFYQSRFFSSRLLYQIQGFPGVASVAPLSVNYLRWKNALTGVNLMIAVLACNPSQNPFRSPQVASQVHLLTNSESVLFDVQSAKADYGMVGEEFERQGEVISEVEHRRVKVTGVFSMGQTLAATGHLIAGDEAMGRFDPRRPANMINMGLVTVGEGADVREVRQGLVAFLPKDVRVMTRKEFQSEEQKYWMSRTAIGFICVAGMVVGMFVGAIVVYQVGTMTNGQAFFIILRIAFETGFNLRREFRSTIEWHSRFRIECLPP